MKKNIFILLLFISFQAFCQSPFLIEEEFDNSPTAPAGWTFTGITAYTSNQNSGKSTNSLKFSATGNQAVSTTWASGDQLTFMMIGTSSQNATDKMKVELLISGVWTTIGNAYPSTTARIFVYNISTSATQARFTYTKGNTNVAFDDFTIRQSGQCTGTGPYITSINVDACGSGCEGRDEFFTFLTGSTAMNLIDIEISYPNANNSCVTWCGSATNAPCDNYITTNTTEVANLNTLAGCTVFLSPVGSIPAYAPVMVFNGNPQNTETNFSSLCSGGSPLVQYFALFANNTSDCNGRFGNYNSTASCTPDCERDFFIRDRGTGCTDTNYYFEDNVGLSDGSGNHVDGASVYYSSAGATPNYVMTNCGSYLVLPVSVLSFFAVNDQDKINVIWKTASESNLSNYLIERSTDGQNYLEIGNAKPTNTNEKHNYSLLDENIDNVSGYYYRLVSVDINGNKEFYQSVFVPVISNNEDIKIISNYVTVKVLINGSESDIKTIEIFDATGTKLLNDTFVSLSYEFSTDIIKNKVSIIRITDSNRVLIKKIIISN